MTKCYDGDVRYYKCIKINSKAQVYFADMLFTHNPLRLVD